MKNIKISTKEAYRIFYMVKGHLDCTESTARECYDNYFQRCWYNQESWVREDRFEKAWSEKYGK